MFGMASNPETLAFAGRLQQALKRCSKPVRTPSELALFFNLHHKGGPVTCQAAQKWLSGKARPSPEKLETLARLCSVSPHWLRHGLPDSPPMLLPPPPIELSPLPPDESALLESFRTLPDRQRVLVVDLVAQMAANLDVRAMA
jgi:transcriptional regulator with XRE-family HTH domain